jgi:hypothetical protein
MSTYIVLAPFSNALLLAPRASVSLAERMTSAVLDFVSCLACSTSPPHHFVGRHASLDVPAMVVAFSNITGWICIGNGVSAALERAPLATRRLVRALTDTLRLFRALKDVCPVPRPRRRAVALSR